MRQAATVKKKESPSSCTHGDERYLRRSAAPPTKPNQVRVISIQVKRLHWAPSAKNRSPEGSRHQSNQPPKARRESRRHSAEQILSRMGKVFSINIATNTIIHHSINAIYHSDKPATMMQSISLCSHRPRASWLIKAGTGWETGIWKKSETHSRRHSEASGLIPLEQRRGTRGRNARPSGFFNSWCVVSLSCSTV